nr:choline/ethanolamine kinase family protein [Sneathiella marina]
MTVEPLSGGMTNENFLVSDGDKRFVVRLGDDIAVHHVSRSNEFSASEAAHAAGISPAVRYHEPGVLVLDYIESKTLTAEDIRSPVMLEQIVPLIKACHQRVPQYFKGPAKIFWVFHVLRDYARSLEAAESPFVGNLPEYLRIASELEKISGPYDIVFGHNDLLPANFLDDGDRLWLIDWDYAGFNTPLFDLGGMASNSQLSEEQQRFVLEAYFDTQVTEGLWKRYEAVKVASLLREVMWSMVSESYSTLDFDYRDYTQASLMAFETAYQEFARMFK